MSEGLLSQAYESGRLARLEGRPRDCYMIDPAMREAWLRAWDTADDAISAGEEALAPLRDALAKVTL